MLPESLGLLHLAVVGASIFIISRAVGGAVGGSVADAVGGSMADAVAVAGSIFIAFAVFVRFSVLVVFSVGIYSGAVLVHVLLWQTFALHVGLDPEV